jgi:SAM-dependent methyltransferase
VRGASFWIDVLKDRAGVLPGSERLRERRVARAAEERPGLPPARLRVAVDGSGDPDWFLRSGATAAEIIRSLLPLEGDVLDFGCGCGRVARHLGGVNGCDYDSRMVEWCAENLPGEFRVNPLAPPTSYDSESFDAIYAISVLTHLPEDLAGGWLEEWRRILRPGGKLLVTVHGDAYRDRLGQRQRARYDAGELVVKHPFKKGTCMCNAHHPRPYMERFLRGFELEHFRPGAAGEPFTQDVYVASRA